MIYLVQVGEFEGREIVTATQDEEFATKTAENLRKSGEAVELLVFKDGKEDGYVPRWQVDTWMDKPEVELLHSWEEGYEFHGTYVVQAETADKALEIALIREEDEKKRLDNLKL